MDIHEQILERDAGVEYFPFFFNFLRFELIWVSNCACNFPIQVICIAPNFCYAGLREPEYIQLPLNRCRAQFVSMQDRFKIRQVSGDRPCVSE